MTHVLILDDDAYRFRILHRWAETVVGACKPIYVKTANEAIEELQKQERWDLLMLDHDLGGRVFVLPEDPDTGYQVAKFIVEHNIKFDRCILHSLNDAAAQFMGHHLKEAGGRVSYVPIILMM
ncbi:hypothetical protein LCGC14_2734560 [marine sediment metagenome]|uniref:Response regulatory domain-containing protein n=1 Tax=marine sediment metagenome TaxID=412755 RepID=A0A0F9BXW5_9ZZZZ